MVVNTGTSHKNETNVLTQYFQDKNNVFLASPPKHVLAKPSKNVSLNILVYGQHRPIAACIFAQSGQGLCAVCILNYMILYYSEPSLQQQHLFPKMLPLK